MTTIETLIEIEGLCKTYPGGSSPALDGLDLQVTRGSIFGLLGPNGAGKTTCISILCTLLRPDQGRVRLLGTDLPESATALRRHIGLVPQDIALYPSLSAKENLHFFARMAGLSPAQVSTRVLECLELVGLSDCVDQRVETFSGGMKRRANLAVAILHRPQLLFLDEPTVGIDPQSRHLILERLRDLNRAGMTLVYTSHYMDEVQHLCDQLVIIDQGQAIASGSPQQLLAGRDDCSNLEQLFLALTGRALRDGGL